MNDTERRHLEQWEAELQAGWPHRLPGHKRQPCLIVILVTVALWAVLALVGWLAWDLARTWP